MSATNFTQELWGEIQRWVNLPMPTDLVQLRTHVDTAVISHYASVASPHHEAIAQAQDALTSLEGDYDAADELLVKNRATIKALSAQPPGGRGGSPVAICDPAVYNGSKEDLYIFLDRLAKKLGGDSGPFT
ncbi:hypothetical protein Q9L58_007837 [Maublancomyces gigas]|uniref:Uncharacterized protein n=1 Tax=Discina gigas TaxID=1032678 RepID=A0ABR3GBG6_9PEZI